MVFLHILRNFSTKKAKKMAFLRFFVNFLTILGVFTPKIKTNIQKRQKYIPVLKSQTKVCSSKTGIY